MQSCSVVEACTGMLIPVCRGSCRVDLPPQLHHALLVSWCGLYPLLLPLLSLPHPPSVISNTQRTSGCCQCLAAAIVASPSSRRRRRIAVVASPSSRRRRRIAVVASRRRLRRDVAASPPVAPQLSRRGNGRSEGARATGQGGRRTTTTGARNRTRGEEEEGNDDDVAVVGCDSGDER